MLDSECDNRTIRANLNKSCEKTINVKDIVNIAPASEKEKHTKLGLFKRFLSDVMLQKKKQANKGSRSRLGTRTPADGCYDNKDENGRMSPVGIENEREFLRRHNSYLNAAFIESEDTSDETANNDIVHNDSVDLEDEHEIEDDSICELERNICEMSESDSDDIESDSSDNESPFCCESENTVIKCERIIDMFRKVELSDEDIVTEDDHMESFMKTLVYNSDSDEGMGSLDSDSE